MDASPTLKKISRIDSRFRHSAEDILPKEGSARKRAVAPAVEEEEEAESPLDDLEEAPLVREQERRLVMGRAHGDFHRRQALGQRDVLTMVVEVVATVGVNGDVIAQETITPALPSVPAVPSVPIPAVPSVPPFPSDLTVPAYPIPSAVISVQAAITNSLNAASSPAPTATGGIGSLLPSALSASRGFNSTIPGTALSSSFSSPSLSSSTILESTSSVSASSTYSSPSSTSTSTRSLSPRPSTSSANPSSASQVLGPGGGAPTNTAAPPASSTGLAATGAQPNSTPLGTPKVVGSVLGSLAGVALILALVLFLLKRHKRTQRGGALQLPGSDAADSQPIVPSGQMATRSSFVPAAAATFLNRFSGTSRSTADTSTTGERSFQRISGRKLPSAFSEGMTSEQFARLSGTMSNSSFYKDDHGVYGGPGAAPKGFGRDIVESANTGAMGTTERFMPSPARTPVIHHPEDAPPFGTGRNGGSLLSPPLSPNPEPPPRGTLGRSHPSHDGSRGSRFTEDV